jgi:three-Cys-motif partner protein
MTTPSTTVRKLDPHTRAKHQILRKYLDAWLPIISRYNGRVVFIDGFAGPGVYEDGEPGSPSIALQALLEHPFRDRMQGEIVFYYIEADASRHAKLEQVIEGLRSKLPSKVKVIAVCDEYEKRLRGIFAELEKTASRLAPSLLFIDPFGVKGIPLELVQRVMAVPRCEVLVNLMSGPAHRFAVTPEFEPHLTDVYGGADWKPARDLTGSMRLDFLRRLYVQKLREGDAGAKYVSTFAMHNKKDQLIYDLVFATNHVKGIEAFKQAIWKVDAENGARFSDAVDPSQQGILTDLAGHDVGLLDMLRAKFSGQTVAWPVVEEAIHQSPFKVKKTPVRDAAKQIGSGITRTPSTGALNEKSVLTFDTKKS